MSHLQAAYHQLLMSDNSTLANSTNIQTLLLLIVHAIGLISENNTNVEAKNNDSIMYLNTLEEQLGPSVSASYTRNVMTDTTNNTLSKKTFLEFENKPSDLKSNIHIIGLSELTIITQYQPHLVMPIHKLLVLFIYLTQQRDFYSGVNTNL
jgi:hypothetical protein